MLKILCFGCSMGKINVKNLGVWRAEIIAPAVSIDDKAQTFAGDFLAILLMFYMMHIIMYSGPQATPAQPSVQLPHTCLGTIRKLPVNRNWIGKCHLDWFPQKTPLKIQKMLLETQNEKNLSGWYAPWPPHNGDITYWTTSKIIWAALI